MAETFDFPQIRANEDVRQTVADLLRRDWLGESKAPSQPRDLHVALLPQPRETPEKGDGKPAKTYTSLASEHGLSLKIAPDKIQFTMQLDGQTKVVASCDKTPKGIAEAEKEIRKQTLEKRESIQKSYGVTFSGNHEEVEKQVTGVGPNETLLRNNKMIHAREPKLTELYGIESALAKSAPSHLDVDGKTPVKFYFLKDTYIEGDTGTTAANFVAKDKNGKAAVYFGPKQSDSRPITEKDAEKLGITDEHSMQSLLTHELAHNTVYRLKWDDSTTLERKCKEMGWAPYQSPTGETTWIIQAKANELYRIDSELTSWVRCDDKGSYLNDKGQPVPSEEKALRITPAQMRDRALLRPPTDYFDNPIELFAESMMSFRVSEKRRAEFAKTSPELYKFIREQDQAEIDLAYRTSKKIRLPDGSIAGLNAATRKAVSDFEARAGLK